MSNIIQFDGLTTKDLDPDIILENNKGTYKTLIYCGYDKDGEFSCGGSTSDTAKIILMLEIFKRHMLEGIE